MTPFYGLFTKYVLVQHFRRKSLQGREYRKPSSDVFLEYIDYPESNFEGVLGFCKEGI